MSRPVTIPTADVFARLWVHEASRVFHDRLINQDNRDFFIEQIVELVKLKFRLNWEADDMFGNNTVMFSNILRLDADDVLYEEIVDR